MSGHIRSHIKSLAIRKGQFVMTDTASWTPEARTAEQRAQTVVHRILMQADAIPRQQGGGHRLDPMTLHAEVLGALREIMDDLVLAAAKTS